MDFRIADTFTDSLAHLTGDEQRAVKTTAFDLQMNPAHPGMSLHKLDKARDKNFWSVRVSRDIRLIVHRSASSLLMCYVGHHDDAYEWAGRRKLETHPRTGAAQLVEIRERVEEIAIPKYVEVEQPAPAKPKLFSDKDDEELLAWGVPAEWLADVQAADEDSLLEIADHLPSEAAEALLEYATGGSPEAAAVATPEQDPFAHRDAQRRFRVMADREELERALEFPWEKWAIFLHPAQREWVEKDYSGPARVSGSAGTGKTVVALHRAVHLAQTHPDSRILLATFSETLARTLETKLKRLVKSRPRLAERIDVAAMDAIGERLYKASGGGAVLATAHALRHTLHEVASNHPDHGFSESFLWAEWRDVVDAWQLDSWEAYRDVQRLGRRTRLPETRRQVAWAIFAEMAERMRDEARITRAGMFAKLARDLPQRQHLPYDFAVLDEAQDVSVAQLRFLAALGGDRPNALFFAGDLGQRIFQQPFSWKSQGVDIRGRSRTLRINYRTSHQIRMQADRLLEPEVSDVDENVEQRKGTVSVFNGPVPEIRSFDDASAESQAVAAWLAQRLEEGIAAGEMAVFVRSLRELDRARATLEVAGIEFCVLDDATVASPDALSVSTMHRAKGMEFRAVAVMACDADVIPLLQRLESVADAAELEEVYDTERHLLYVACTRARDSLLVTAVSPTSEFLEDLIG